VPSLVVVRSPCRRRCRHDGWEFDDRWELRAAADERVHDAVVSDAVRHVSAQVDGTPRLGRRTAGGVRDTAACVRRHLGNHAGVSSVSFLSLGHLYLIRTKFVCPGAQSCL